MVEDFGPEAIKYNEKMIVLSTQLDDWGDTSANMAIELTEYFLENYNIDTNKVFLHGMSGDGETGSLVMGKRPNLYTAFLITDKRYKDQHMGGVSFAYEDDIMSWLLGEH